MSQFYPPMPPAGTFPYQQQQQAYYPPQPQTYYPPQQYPQPPQQYGQSYQQYPPQNTQYPPPYAPAQATYPPQQSWQPGPPHEGGFQHHAPQQNWDPRKIYAEQNGLPDYNNPPDPMYGKPNDGTEDFVKPDRAPDFTTEGAGQPGADGERGLGATLVGGAGGAFLGHKMEHGALGTLGGVLIGAIAANAIEHHEKKKKEERRDVREFDQGYEAGERRGSVSRSRGLDEQSEYRDDRSLDEYRDYDDYERPPHHHHHHHEPRYDDGYYSEDYRSDYRDDYRDDYRNERY